ncbi:hypothetical protein NQ314_001395 [Rhamnusium bicolor]|uniref:Uncharacterized protein n=1 Tax=Rhamnusium bicolor TaxID=1586634 RepID=A0AAV8ZUJ1_9CUCU|nr:hypothetical protein NQ314_001395 [Rhamnusium bicolor]
MVISPRGANWSYDGGGVTGAGAICELFLDELVLEFLLQHHSEHDTIKKKAISPPNEAMYHTTDHLSTVATLSVNKFR